MNKILAKKKEPRQSMVSPFRGFFPRTMFNDLIDHYFNEEPFEMSAVMNATMDVAETDHAFEVQMDLPGVQIDDVDIQIDNNTLTVRGERTEKEETEDENKKFHRIERRSGSFSRSVLLPTSIDENESVAEFKDGVLKIVIPKTEDSKPRRIKISK